MQEVTSTAVTALTTAANSIAAEVGSVMNTVAPIVLGVAVGIVAFFAGWKIIKRITGRI